MMRTMLWLLLTLAVIAPCGRSWASDDEFARATLKGLTRFDVAVIRGGYEYAGRIDSVALQTSIELRLRENGIRVGSKTGQLLMVSFYGFPAGDGGCVSYGRLVVLQEVSLLRAPAIQTFTETWSVDRLDGCKCADAGQHVAESARSMMDSFMNAYLAANPKRSGAK